MKLNDVLLVMADFSPEDLLKVNLTSIALIRHKRRLAGMMIKNTLKVNDIVKCNHKRFIGDTFKVLKINRTKANLEHQGTKGVWVINLCMIEQLTK
jgi:GTP-sensing pleiotropic transcriptional regulator CodY|tara:strand:- start:13949 stop:14236 length:288 start_codon:yes stop_codon:yes gene_type:complete